MMTTYTFSLCGLCGDDAVIPGKNHCQKCQNMYVSGSTGQNTSKKCTVRTCLETANPGKDLCSKCYANLLKTATCKSCGKTPNPGKMLCGPCYDKMKKKHAPATPNKPATTGSVTSGIASISIKPNCMICYSGTKCNCDIILKTATHALIRLQCEDRRAEIMKKFLYSWNKYTAMKVNVEGIYCNANPGLRERFTKYRKGIISHKLLRWHGTGQRCDLRKTEKFCGDQTCAVCNICKTGFRIDLCGANTGWSRYGRAIYTAPNASKSHDYNAGSEKCGIRSILLCHVAPGKIYQTTDNMPTITAAPAGFHSVEGVVGPILNYPELCTYDNESVYPAYVIFYRIL